MERPERPSRHKSKPVKYPIRPSFSSDSDSEMNDEMFINPQQAFEQGYHGNVGAGPSTSSTSVQQNAPESTSNNNFIVDVAHEVVIGASTSPEPARRKRSADAMVSSSAAAASVIFESVDSLMGMSSSRQSRGGESLDHRFPHSDFVIPPSRFCAIDCLRSGNYKLKRPNGGPIDLTPTSSIRDIPVPVLNSFGMRDSTTLAANAEAAQSVPFNKNTLMPIPSFAPPPPPRGDQPSASSRILSQFDEICGYPSSGYRRRSKGHFTVRVSGTVDDYSELVNISVLNPYPSPVTNSNSLRSPTGNVAGPSASEAHVNDRGRPEVRNEEVPPLVLHPSFIQETNDLLSTISSYLQPPTPPQPPRNDMDGDEMEQNNEDVIVLGTPERPVSPDFVPSSRSPSPTPRYPSPLPATPCAKRDKPQRSNEGEVPMTLQELNQTLVSLLECPVCLDHATPPIYQCGKGHILCQNCHPRLTICPICRSRLPGDRNSTMEKVAEKLMYPCKNTVTGCSEMLKLDDKQQHEEGCGFRHYACIVSICHWKGYKPELVVHLQSHHPEKLLSGDVKEVQIPLGIPGANNMFSSHHWVQSAHNEVFNVIFNIDHYKRLLKGYVFLLDSPKSANRFMYKLELKQPKLPFRVMTFSRMVHTSKVRSSQANDNFFLNTELIKMYQPLNCADANTLPITVSIVPVPTPNQ